jgi:hypothetical protein
LPEGSDVPAPNRADFGFFDLRNLPPRLPTRILLSFRLVAISEAAFHTAAGKVPDAPFVLRERELPKKQSEESKNLA